MIRFNQSRAKITDPWVASPSRGTAPSSGLQPPTAVVTRNKKMAGVATRQFAARRAANQPVDVEKERFDLEKALEKMEFEEER